MPRFEVGFFIFFLALDALPLDFLTHPLAGALGRRLNQSGPHALAEMMLVLGCQEEAGCWWEHLPASSSGPRLLLRLTVLWGCFLPLTVCVDRK